MAIKLDITRPPDIPADHKYTCDRIADRFAGGYFLDMELEKLTSNIRKFTADDLNALQQGDAAKIREALTILCDCKTELLLAMGEKKKSDKRVEKIHEASVGHVERLMLDKVKSFTAATFYGLSQKKEIAAEFGLESHMPLFLKQEDEGLIFTSPAEATTQDH